MNIQKQLENEKQEVQSRELKIKQHNHQIDALQKKLAEKVSNFNAQKAHLEQQHQEEKAGMILNLRLLHKNATHSFKSQSLRSFNKGLLDD